jgi:hypothetical protein
MTPDGDVRWRHTGAVAGRLNPGSLRHIAAWRVAAFIRHGGNSGCHPAAGRWAGAGKPEGSPNDIHRTPSGYPSVGRSPPLPTSVSPDGERYDPGLAPVNTEPAGQQAPNQTRDGSLQRRSVPCLTSPKRILATGYTIGQTATLLVYTALNDTKRRRR